jgi:lysyl-tRNA synthetase class 2
MSSEPVRIAGVAEVCGRVVSRFDLAQDVEIVVLADGEPRRVVAPRSVQAQPGALVRVALDEADRARDVTVLGVPSAPWDPDGDGARWARRVAGASRVELLRRRQRILRAIRDDLLDEGFVEIESPLLVPGACPDAVLESVEATNGHYLVTSTEYQLKRLLVGGVERLFSLTKNFRAGDQGAVHSAEFTMLEWARAWRSLDDIEDDAERLVRRAYRTLRAPDAPGAPLRGRDHEVILDGPRWERVTLRDALARHLGAEVDAAFSLPSMIAAAERARVDLPASFRDDPHLVISVLLDALQPHLGHPLPTFLRAWPAFLTSSAELDPRDPNLALRSELYVAGVELADGFPFLRDAEAQRASFARENARRVASGRAPVRVDDKYVAALAQGIPPGAGMALGVDRLVMVLVGAEEIGDVLPFAYGEL